MTITSWRYCPRCGGRLERHEGPDRHVTCAGCGFRQYENPVPTTLLLPINERNEVLLVRRADPPRAGFWDTLGGFLNVGESAEEGARRELAEELGATCRTLDVLGTYPSVYGDTGRHTLAIGYVCRLDQASDELRLSVEHSAFRWFPLDALPEFAFTDGTLAARDLAARIG